MPESKHLNPSEYSEERKKAFQEIAIRKLELEQTRLKEFKR